MKLLIGIPAYNEGKKIFQVVKSIPKKVKAIDQVDVLVVDDGSGDDTERQAKKAGASVVKHLLNRGLGGALKTIFAYGRQKDYDILVTFDADGQHKPQDIERIVNPIIRRKADIIIGSRWKIKRKAPFSRFLVNQLANLSTFFFFGIRTTDSQSGLRALGKRAIGKIILNSDGMEVSSEFFREIYTKKLKFAEVSIDPVYTRYSQKKGQKIANSPYVFFKLMIKFLRQ